MDFNEYQKQAHHTAVYPLIIIDDKFEPKYSNWIYPLIGLSGEVGELSNKMKKVIRDKSDVFSNEIESEIGDICWYLAEFCTVLGLDLDKIASANLEKLQSRRERGVIKGSGDDR